MSYTSLQHFIEVLSNSNELYKVDSFVSPELEMTEITDRLSKHNSKAVLFTNNGTDYPVLMNSMGSHKRMTMALGMNNYKQYEDRLDGLFSMVSDNHKGVKAKLHLLKKAAQLRFAVPKKLKRKGNCFAHTMQDADLGKLPILKCWPHDGGKFITLPMVHTTDPETGITNIGMYRMQVYDKNSTGMHWHKHKGGAAHFEKYKKIGKRMPVVVTLGGDPVYTYAATAPLPEMISEYAFAGFIRRKKVNLVKCISCNIMVPEDVDFVIEGYIDPTEDLKTEGPFGDHTGFYSLPDKYPVFHITHISHRKKAIYPATIVGIPPMEDAFMGEATEKLFLPLIKKLIAPEIIDMNLPAEGGFHNLAIVSIAKSYPGQAIKVMNALWGAGQMMFVRNIIVVNEDIDVRNPQQVVAEVLKNTTFERDFHFMHGPLDVLDHANSSFTFGKKTGIDATNTNNVHSEKKTLDINNIEGTEIKYLFNTLPIVFFNKEITGNAGKLHNSLCESHEYLGPYIIYMDYYCSFLEFGELLWMFLANFDPEKDLFLQNIDGKISAGFDGSMKTAPYDNIAFIRPNILVMDKKTIETVDAKWGQMFQCEFYNSPSLRYKKITLNEGYLFDK